MPDPAFARTGSARLEVGLAARGALRWVAADITDVLEEGRRRLDLSPIAAVALGRSLTAAALIQRISLKMPSRLLVEVIGDGPLGKVIAECDEQGNMRGLVSNPQLETPANGGLRIAPLVGRGMLRVTREEATGGRYSSQVSLVSGELGDDVTHFLNQSQQIRSAVLLGVLPRPTGIGAAGGLVVEALPGAEQEAVSRLEQNIRCLEGVSFYLDKGGLGGLAEAVLEDLEPERISGQKLGYHCRCSREGLREQLQTLAASDLEDLLAESGECEAVCAFCGVRHRFAERELTAGEPERPGPDASPPVS